MFSATRFSELCEDIRVNGQREAVKLFDGKILDGRNRAKACEKLGIALKTETLPADLDPWAYVWSLNGARRDLVDEQRYLIGKFCHEQSEGWQVERARIRDEGNRKRSESQKGVSKADASERRGTQSTTTLHVARESKAKHFGVNVGAVAKGDALAAKRPDLAEKVRVGEVKPAEAHRQMKRDEVSKKAAALPSGKFRIIYADPPWKYGDGRTGDLMTATGALHHYPTMALSELKAIGVRDLGADDSVLFLWATSPLLPDALELAAAWGFKYKASFVWDKVRHNLGTYNSVRHEFLLICTRGSATPEVSKLFDSVQVIEKTDKHSAKPEEFREIIDTLYPSGTRIELFRRGDAPNGWVVYGNEC